MSTLSITPAEVNALPEHHIMLIDIRSSDEYRREHISGARSVPLEQINSTAFTDVPFTENDIIIFHCQSGMRTNNVANQLSTAVQPAKALIMQGGLNAWKAAGYPVISDRRQPLPLMQQVQITAGIFALGGTLAGALLTPVLYFIPGLVGTGLIFAGITGWCGVAKLLTAMPWNK